MLDDFQFNAEPIWLQVMPGGSVDIKQISYTPDRVHEYVAKELGHELQYQQFLTPDEFRRFVAPQRITAKARLPRYGNNEFPLSSMNVSIARV